MAKDKPNPTIPADALAEAKPAAAGVEGDPRDAEISLLKAQMAALLAANEQTQAMLKAGAVNAVDVQQEALSRKEQDAWKAEIAKGTAQLSQEAANRRYPTGRFRYLCSLADGNGHPELSIAAENEVDAKARYLDVCGVTAAEKPVAALKS